MNLIKKIKKILIGHSDDYNFQEKINGLLIGRRIVGVEKFDDNQTAVLELDNGYKIVAIGNEGCGGCENGWFYFTELASCENAITRVECCCENDWDDFVYHLYVFADNRKINCLQCNGCDNGYYGTGYDLYVLKPEEIM